MLDARVTTGSWDGALEGEVWMLDGSKSVFGPEAFTDELKARLESFDIHPTGPLWGEGDLRSGADAAACELQALQGDSALRLRAGLEQARLSQERRALRMMPGAMSWDWLGEDALEVRFALAPGCYATTVLRELGEVVDAAAPNPGSAPLE